MIALNVTVYREEASVGEVAKEILSLAQKTDVAVTVTDWPSLASWTKGQHSLTALPHDTVLDVIEGASLPSGEPR